MKRFLRPFVWVLIAIYNAICVVSGGASLKKLLPTGVITSGILGGFSGKVGPVVGGKWKDIDYMREYVVPTNPNTTGQQAVRAKFGALVAIARALLGALLQPFWDPFNSAMSGFNAWISKNYNLSDSAGAIDETAIMSQGTLQPIVPATATYATGTGSLGFTFSGTSIGNGEPNDNIGVVVYNTHSGQVFFQFGDAARIEASGEINVGPGFTASELIIWLFAYRGTGSSMIVSDSNGLVVS